MTVPPRGEVSIQILPADIDNVASVVGPCHVLIVSYDRESQPRIVSGSSWMPCLQRFQNHATPEHAGSRFVVIANHEPGWAIVRVATIFFYGDVRP
jgi:hypothetical protein